MIIMTTQDDNDNSSNERDNINNNNIIRLSDNNDGDDVAIDNNGKENGKNDSREVRKLQGEVLLREIPKLDRRTSKVKEKKWRETKLL